MESERSPPRTAVVADDHELSRVALSSILRGRLGFARVVETASLDQALERLDATGATLALFDLDMPGMATASSLAAVRECYPDVRVAVVSGSAGRRDVLLALEAGVHGYVPKTLGIEAITDALREILDGRIFVPPSLAEVRDGAAMPLSRPTAPAPDAAGGTAGGDAPAGLTPRQREVLALLTRGQSNKEISRALGLGEGTVKVHMAALFRALGVQSRAAAAAIGARAQGASRPGAPPPGRPA